MPRKLTEEEIEAVKEFMYERAIDLIIKKGVTWITLDDILDAVQMAKGTFYKYYDSKKLFIYEVITKDDLAGFSTELIDTVEDLLAR